MGKSDDAPFFVDLEVIRLTSDGIWLSDDTEIDHEPTRRLFYKSIRRENSKPVLRVGRERKEILVDDTDYFVTRVDGDARAGFRIWISDESIEPLEPSTIRYKPGRLTAEIKRHGALVEAKFLRAPYFEILKTAQESHTEYWMQIQGTRIVLANK